MTLISIRRIEEAFGACLDTREEPFPFSELSASVAASLGVSESDTEAFRRIERECEILFSEREDFFRSGRPDGLCHPKQSFFRACRFRIAPSAFEIEQGILLPGARFAPYCSGELFPDDYEIRPRISAGKEEEKKGPVLEIREIRAEFGEIAPAYLMLGRAEFIDRLVAESDENYRTLRSVSNIEKAQLDLSVFDLSAFYAAHSFRNGDILLLTVEDWENAVFTMDFLPGSASASPLDQELWISALEHALLQELCSSGGSGAGQGGGGGGALSSSSGPEGNIPDQISRAYLFAFENGEDLRNRPFLGIDEYRYKMREIAIRRDNAEWTLVPADELADPGMEGGNFPAEQEELRGEGEEASEESSPGKCSCGHSPSHHHPHGVAHHGPEGENGACRSGRGMASGFLPGRASSSSCGHRFRQDPDLRTHTEEGDEIVHDITPDQFSASSGNLDSLESILSDTRAPVNSVESFAFIQDAIANGESDFDAFYQRFIALTGIRFVDDAQETAFLNFLDEAWEESLEFYNPAADMAKMPLRAHLLEMTEQRLDLISRSGVVGGEGEEKEKRDVLSRETTGALESVRRQITETLALLNNASELPEGEEYEQLELRVGDIAELWDSLLEKITGELPPSL